MFRNRYALSTLSFCLLDFTVITSDNSGYANFIDASGGVEFIIFASNYIQQDPPQQLSVPVRTMIRIDRERERVFYYFRIRFYWLRWWYSGKSTVHGVSAQQNVGWRAGDKFTRSHGFSGTPGIRKNIEHGS